MADSNSQNSDSNLPESQNLRGSHPTSQPRQISHPQQQIPTNYQFLEMVAQQLGFNSPRGSEFSQQVPFNAPTYAQQVPFNAPAYAQQVPFNAPGVPTFSQQNPCNTPSGSGFPMFSSQIPPLHDDVIVLGKGGKSTAKAKATWTHDDDILLIKAWFVVSNDSVVGNDQCTKEFWERTTEYYNEHRVHGTASRTPTQVKNYYYRIIPDLNKWAGIYNNFSSNRASGQDDNDVLEAALKAWRNCEPKNKEFKWLHVWKVMQTCEKWTPQQMPQNPHKQSKNSESDSPSSADSGARVRPMGQQRAKRLAKQKAKMTDPANEEKWNKIQESMDSQLSMQAERLEMEHMEFICQDTSGMSEAHLRYHNKLVAKIKAKYGWE